MNPLTQAKKPETPAYVLADNFNSLFWWERYAIAQNPNTPDDTLMLMIKDSNRIVRAAAKFNLQSRI